MTEMEPTYKIHIENLNVSAGKQQILNDINIEIPKNKITVILGPSGCGKTTLLKCMNRLTDLYPELKVTGKVIINEKNVLEAGEDIVKLRQYMGLLSQTSLSLADEYLQQHCFRIETERCKKKKGFT